MVYDRLLERRISGRERPDHVVLVLTETDLLRADGFETLDRFLGWCRGLEIPRVRVNVDVLDADDAIVDAVRTGLSDLDESPAVATHDGELDGSAGEGDYVVSVGIGGRSEFVGSLRALAAEVAEGAISPEDVEGEDVERHLRHDGEPDVVIKTGGQHLTDFMIWQSVYSELYFTDVNWQNFRRRDLLRSIRDYQDRERRFGR
jgi:undecaprenyl diphosphate synthase